MKDLLKLMDEIIENSPEIKKLVEEDEKFKEERKNYYLSKGFSEYDSTMKMWYDFWKRAYEIDGVEFSIRQIEYNI